MACMKAYSSSQRRPRKLSFSTSLRRSYSKISLDSVRQTRSKKMKTIRMITTQSIMVQIPPATTFLPKPDLDPSNFPTVTSRASISSWSPALRKLPSVWSRSSWRSVTSQTKITASTSWNISTERSKIPKMLKGTHRFEWRARNFCSKKLPQSTFTTTRSSSRRYLWAPGCLSKSSKTKCSRSGKWRCLTSSAPLLARAWWSSRTCCSLRWGRPARD